MVYPTTEEVREWFKLQESGQAPKFFDLYVRDDVKWTVEVSQLSVQSTEFTFLGNTSYCGCFSRQGRVYGWNNRQIEKGDEAWYLEYQGYECLRRRKSSLC